MNMHQLTRTLSLALCSITYYAYADSNQPRTNNAEAGATPPVVILDGVGTFSIGDSLAEVQRKLPKGLHQRSSAVKGVKGEEWQVAILEVTTGGTPHSFVLIKNQLAAVEPNKSIEAVEVPLKHYILYGMAQNKLASYTDAERYLSDVIQGLLSKDVSIEPWARSLVNELIAFRLLVAEKQDKGVLTETEARYEIAQKNSEIEQRLLKIQTELGILATAKVQANSAQSQADALRQQNEIERQRHRRAAALGLLRQAVDLSKPRQPTGFSCTSTPFGGSIRTNCD